MKATDPAVDVLLFDMVKVKGTSCDGCAPVTPATTLHANPRELPNGIVEGRHCNSFARDPRFAHDPSGGDVPGTCGGRVRCVGGAVLHVSERQGLGSPASRVGRAASCSATWTTSSFLWTPEAAEI